MDTKSGSLRRDMTHREIAAQKADLELIKTVRKIYGSKRRYFLRAHFTMESNRPIDQDEIRRFDPRIKEVCVTESWNY